MRQWHGASILMILVLQLIGAEQPHVHERNVVVHVLRHITQDAPAVLDPCVGSELVSLPADATRSWLADIPRDSTIRASATARTRQGGLMMPFSAARRTARARQAAVATTSSSTQALSGAQAGVGPTGETNAPSGRIQRSTWA